MRRNTAFNTEDENKTMGEKENKLLDAIDEQDNPIAQWDEDGNGFTWVHISSEGQLMLMSKRIGDEEYRLDLDLSHLVI